jgi:hypothetical protein
MFNVFLATLAFSAALALFAALEDSRVSLA